MHELPRQLHKRMMTDIAFGKTLAAAAAFSLAIAEEQARERDERHEGARDAFAVTQPELTH